MDFKHNSVSLGTLNHCSGYMDIDTMGSWMGLDIYVAGTYFLVFLVCVKNIEVQPLCPQCI